MKKAEEKLGKEILKLEGRLNSKGFADKALKEVVDKAREEPRELVEPSGWRSRPAWWSWCRTF